MSPDHPYAPGLKPAGVFLPGVGVEVADHITLPDGTQRMLHSREATLRHEIGHAIDHITGLSDDQEIQDAVIQGVHKMTPEERKVAAYWLGEKYPTTSPQAKASALRSETFAELYAYAFNDGAEEDYGTFGGMDFSRRYELFGKARQLIRQKVAAAMGDRMLDLRWRKAA